MIRYLPLIERNRLKQEILRSISRLGIRLAQTSLSLSSEMQATARDAEKILANDISGYLNNYKDLIATYLNGPVIEGISELAIDVLAEFAHLMGEIQRAEHTLRVPDARLDKIFPSLNVADGLCDILNSESSEQGLNKILANLNGKDKLKYALTLGDKGFWASSYVPVGFDPENRVKIIGMSIAYAIAEEQNVAFFETLLDDFYDLLLPEALRIIRSLLLLRQLDRPIECGIIFAMYGEQANLSIQSNHRNDLNDTVFQLSQLSVVNQNFRWKLIGVCDGDDRNPDITEQNMTSADVARLHLKSAHPELLDKSIFILQLDDEIKREYHSIKGGAVLFGARFAAEELTAKPEIIIFNDLKPDFPYYTLGELISPLINEEAEVTIASRSHPGTVAERDPKRWVMSSIYSSIRSFALPEISHLFDTQAALKAFRTESLLEILPVAKARSSTDWQRDFDYSLSFDTMVLAKLRRANKRILEVPSVLIGYWGGATPFAAEMAQNLFQQRHFLDDQKAREMQAVHQIAGGFDLQVYSRDDLKFVIKTPKFESAVGNTLLRLFRNLKISETIGRNPKASMTHNLLAQNWAVELLNHLGQLPPVVLSDVFSLMRLIFSPWSTDLTGYEIAARSAGGIIPNFEMAQNLPVRVLADGRWLTEQQAVTAENCEIRIFQRAIIQEKIDPSKSIAKLLRDVNLKQEDALNLFHKCLNLQKLLWRRGIYNLDVTYYLVDTLVNQDGELIYCDPGDFTDDFDIALESIRNELNSNLQERVDVKRLYAESPEFAELYLKELTDLFTEENFRNNWRQDPPVPVSSPNKESLSEISPANEQTEIIPQLYQIIISNFAETSAAFIPEK
jgi:hypothetical protein